MANPISGAGGGGKAPPFNPASQTNPQKSYSSQYDVETSGASGTPPGGLLPFDEIAKQVNPERAKEIGVGTVGDSRMPFRVSGGKK